MLLTNKRLFIYLFIYLFIHKNATKYFPQYHILFFKIKKAAPVHKRCREDTICLAFLVGCRRLVIFGIRQDIKMAGLSGACLIILIKFILKFFSCYFFLLRQTLFLFCQKTKEVKGTVAQEKLFN